MNDAPSVDALDPRRRRALFRSWHRGTREMDLILGPFADAAVASLTPAELEQYEALLEQADTDLYPWFAGERPPPDPVDGDLFRRIRRFIRR